MTTDNGVPYLGPQASSLKPAFWPAVTCLCPTYGRFECLRLALSCFLAQDYPGEKRLVVLNDAEIPLTHGGLFPGVHVYSMEAQYANLGEKRQALLEMASTPLVAHWDDDDLYLPWHLTRSVAALMGRKAGCVKSRGAWYMTGCPMDPALDYPGSSFIDRGYALSVRGPCHNVFEGTMVFYRDQALALGGYPPLHSGQAKALMDKFRQTRTLYEIRDDDSFVVPSSFSLHPSAFPSYVYRWGNAVGHISGIGNAADAADRFRSGNQDFGDGRPLMPGDPRPYVDALLRHTIKVLSMNGAPAFGSNCGPLTGAWDNPRAGEPMYAPIVNAGRPRP